VFTEQQRSAVRDTFYLAGYEGDLRTLPLESGDAVAFVLGQEHLLRMRDPVVIERVLALVLDRKVLVLASVGDQTVAF